LPQFRHLCQIIACATLATPFATAHTGQSTTPATELPALPPPIRADIAEVEAPSYVDQLWSLPIFRFFTPSFATTPEYLTPEPDAVAMMESVPGCTVEPLAEIEDSEALALENRTGALGAVDIDGLTPSTQLALARFQRIVTSAGGAIAITSAYRPAAYQEHLRSVWEKWMFDLRSNTDPLCQDLRAQVGEEFREHSLLESQRPVVLSDHTRGLSFDAAVRLPRLRKGRRVSVDLLARRAGILRPARASDPVHFRLAM
jgi:hypothetical protein